MYAHLTRRSRQRPTAVALALTGVLAACADGAPRITEPEAGAPAAGVALTEVGCQVAVRTPGDRYSARRITLQAPARIARPGAEPTSFGVLEWRDGLADPSRLTVCEIPNTPAAKEWVRRTLLRGRPELNLRRPAANAGALASRVAAAAAGARPRPTGALQMVSTLESGYQLCEYDTDCGGEYPIEEEIGPEPPPPEYSETSDETYLDPYYSDPYVEAAALAPVIVCNHQTQYPHISGFDISVHGLTKCSAPVSSITLNVTLRKQRCIWFICWMSDRASSGPRSSPFGWSYLDVPLHIRCEPGYWDGKTNHSVTHPPGYWPSTVYRTSYSTMALLVRWC